MIGVVVEADIAVTENFQHIPDPAVTAAVVLKAVRTGTKLAAVYRHIVLFRKRRVPCHALFQIVPIQHFHRIHIPHVHAGTDNGIGILGVHLKITACLIAVSFSWGSLWGGFGMNTSLATGLMLVPLLIGIGLLFFLDRKWIGWVVTAIGLLAILVTLLTSVRFRPVSASLWQYVVMFGMIAAGCGLVARGLLKSRD